MEKVKRVIAKSTRRSGVEAKPVYAYKANGKLERAYANARAYAAKHDVGLPAVYKALRLGGKCAGLRVRFKKTSSLPEIVVLDYPLYPSFALYRYDWRGKLLGRISRNQWSALVKTTRVNILNSLHKTSAVKTSGYYYSRIKGPDAFKGVKSDVQNSGRLLVVFPNGRRHYYPRAAEAALDLGIHKYNIAHYAKGSRKDPEGRKFQYA